MSSPILLAAVRAFRTACPNVERLVAFGLCDAASAVLMAAYPHGQTTPRTNRRPIQISARDFRKFGGAKAFDSH